MKAAKSSTAIRANKRKAKLKAKHRRQRARATGDLSPCTSRRLWCQIVGAHGVISVDGHPPGPWSGAPQATYGIEFSSALLA